MMMNPMITALTAEVEMLNASYVLAIEQTQRLLSDSIGRTPSTHLGHNLASRAAELSVIAGKLETAKATLAFAQQQTAN
jgi:hypothetical protein